MRLPLPREKPGCKLGETHLERRSGNLTQSNSCSHSHKKVSASPIQTTMSGRHHFTSSQSKRCHYKRRFVALLSVAPSARAPPPRCFMSFIVEKKTVLTKITYAALPCYGSGGRHVHQWKCQELTVFVGRHDVFETVWNKGFFLLYLC